MAISIHSSHKTSVTEKQTRGIKVHNGRCRLKVLHIPELRAILIIFTGKGASSNHQGEQTRKLAGMATRLSVMNPGDRRQVT
ncbi:hypothetical protein E2C01_091356 [Portunus trituberculatus]|uniref:Uncharacterized protein n=1 Tax=Portunus trituberculatus TaxID=210409 RepID=A0A5B7JP63_PORTR|nr:hypothetical protein [Portunus trituberculatus]